MAIIHICLNVADAERAVNWYTEQLGFEETWGFESGDTTNRYVADDDGVELQLAETDGETPSGTGELWDHFAIGVDDVDQAFAEIETPAVVQAPADQPAADARTAFIEDPDGHTVELVQPLAD